MEVKPETIMPVCCNDETSLSVGHTLSFVDSLKLTQIRNDTLFTGLDFSQAQKYSLTLVELGIFHKVLIFNFVFTLLRVSSFDLVIGTLKLVKLHEEF